MRWTDKSREEIRDAILAISREETGLSSFKEGGVLRGLVETYTQTIYPLYQDVINFYGGQFTYMEASGTILDLRGRELGVERRKTRKTLGVFRVDAVKSGIIREGAWFLTPAELRFKALEDTAFHAGSNGIAVEAEFPGALYNILPNTAIRSTFVIDGINSISAPENWISIPGRDEESDADYKKRIRAKWDALGTDNRPGKYEVAALSIDGVNDVKVIRTPRGSGSIDIIIGGEAGIPSKTIFDDVYQAISDSYLLARDILVKPAAAVQREFQLSFSGDASENQVEQSLRLWLQARKIGESVIMQKLYQEALKTLEIKNLEFQKPTQSIVIGPTSKIIPSSIVVAKRLS